jgi:hypothetical protein
VSYLQDQSEHHDAAEEILGDLGGEGLSVQYELDEEVSSNF